MQKSDGTKANNRKIVVTYPEDKKAPVVEFVGQFTGRDIMTLGRIIAISYRVERNRLAQLDEKVK